MQNKKITLADRLNFIFGKNPPRGTFTELANKVGIKKQTLHKYKKGDIQNIPSDVIERLADALKVTPSYLLGWEDYGELPPKMFSDLVFCENIQKLYNLNNQHKEQIYNNISFWHKFEKENPESQI